MYSTYLHNTYTEIDGHINDNGFQGIIEVSDPSCPTTYMEIVHRNFHEIKDMESNLDFSVAQSI